MSTNDTRPSQQADDVAPDNAPCERTPLLPGRDRPYRYSWWTHDSHPWFCEMPKYLLMLVLIIVFLGTVRGTIIGLRDVMDTTTMVVQDTKIVDLVGKDGIEVAVRGHLELNYAQVDHDIARFLIRHGASLLDHVTVQPTTMNITQVVFHDDEVPLYEQVTLVDVPTLRLNTSDGAPNNIDTVVTLHDYDPYTVARLGELMLAGKPFTLSGTARISIGRGWLSLGSYQITSQQTINQNIDEDDFVEYKLQGMKVSGAPGQLTVDANVSLKTSLVSNLDFPELAWDIYHRKCEADLSKGKQRTIVVGQPEGDYLMVGKARSLPFHLADGENDVTVSVTLNTEDPILALCEDEEKEGDGDDDGDDDDKHPTTPLYSTLDKIMTTFINGNSSLYNTHLSPKQPKLPDSLASAMSHFWALLDAPGLDRNDSLLQNISFEHVSIASLSTGAVFIDADVETDIILPENVKIHTEMLPVKVRGINDLYYEGELFARAHLQEWHDCDSFQGVSGSQTTYNVKVAAKNVPVEVVDTAIFRKVASKLIWTGNVPILFNATVDALVGTTIGNLTLSGMHILKETELNK